MVIRSMLIIGSHVSFRNTQLYGSLKEALSYGANTFMFYTGAPTNTKRSELNDSLTMDAYELMNENNIKLENIICHAPYIVNLANRSDEEKYQFSVNFLKNEVDRCQTLGITKLVLHPGSAVNVSKEEGLQNIIDGLNQILLPNSKVIILLETMAGKGSELGISIEEIKTIIDNVNEKESIGICLDTCHLNDAGYSIDKFDEYLDELDQKIGLDKIGCIHINDSKNDRGSHKDRHANIGFGTIGFDNLINVIYNPRLEGIPKILETPYIGETDDDKNRLYPPYKFEIEMIRNKTFDNKVLNKVREYYK